MILMGWVPNISKTVNFFWKSKCLLINLYSFVFFTFSGSFIFLLFDS
ncbi:hypothetical protein SynROS8604_01328 [Synechococcus sp. ROS8604]|nr:hypothetical protein SynROS8604_01328 [Synechococcus sp. ROS8604]